jgi:hypothetical protein
MAESASDAMDHRHHFLAPWYSKSSSIAEIILHVDNQQNVAVNQFYAHDSLSVSVPAAGPGALSTNEKTIAQAKMMDAWLGEQCVPGAPKKNALNALEVPFSCAG